MNIIFAGDLHLTHKTPSSRLDDYPTTILTKLEWILSHKGIKIFTGDIFDRIDIPREYLNKVINVFEKFKDEEVYTIVGNHDMLYGSNQYMNRTPIGILFSTKFLKPLDTLETPEFEIIGWNYGENGRKYPTTKKKAILVAHGFYEVGQEKERILQSDIDRFDVAVFGHDHNIYEEKGLLFRPGSISRMTSKNEDSQRDFIQILDMKEDLSYNYVKYNTDKNVFNQAFIQLKRKVKETKKFDISIFKNFEAESLEHILESQDFSEFANQTKEDFKRMYAEFK